MAEVVSEELTQESLDVIMKELATAGRKLPVEAIQRARRHQQQIIPELIKALRAEADLVRNTERRDEQTAFFALFLLAEFRASEALPAIVEAISLPGEGPFILFGDAIHDVLPRILVSLAGERCIEVSSALVRNPALNEYVRWSAAKAIVYLAMVGLRPRAEVITVCRDILREAIERKDEHAVTGMIMSMLDMKPWEAAKEIEWAFQERLMDEGMVDWDSVKEYLTDQPIGSSHEYGDAPSIDDTIKELEHWASFRETEPPRRAPILRPPSPPRVPPMTESRVPFLKPDRIGRNDPCYCGSGKKFKKCCGKRQ